MPSKSGLRARSIQSGAPDSGDARVQCGASCGRGFRALALRGFWNAFKSSGSAVKAGMRLKKLHSPRFVGE